MTKNQMKHTDELKAGMVVEFFEKRTNPETGNEETRYGQVFEDEYCGKLVSGDTWFPLKKDGINYFEKGTPSQQRILRVWLPLSNYAFGKLITGERNTDGMRLIHETDTTDDFAFLTPYGRFLEANEDLKAKRPLEVDDVARACEFIANELERTEPYATKTIETYRGAYRRLTMVSTLGDMINDAINE